MQRKIGTTHMAFYRGWLQGLPLRDMADAYLETGLDLRSAKATLRWIQDELRRTALRRGHYGQARLLRLRIADVRPAAAVDELPSVDTFREEFDPSGFYNFDELMVHYLVRYPNASNRRADRRAQLLERQIAALNTIEGLLVTDPVPADPVDAWLDPSVADRLRAASILTLSDLSATIAARGYHWCRAVPKLGQTRAARIVLWMGHYSKSLGALPGYAVVKPNDLTATQKRRAQVDIIPSGNSGLAVLDPPGAERAEEAGIVPLEAMLLPRARVVPVAGAGVQSLADGSHIAATDDRAAIESWLNAQAGSAATFRAYRKEAERLVLWAAHERRSTLSGLDVEGCAAYRDWLCALGRVDAAGWHYRLPQEAWFAPRYTKRYSPAWRPFEGPLSPRSVSYALTVCQALFGWLTQVRYLSFDPWPAVASPRASAGAAPDMELTRALSRDDWARAIETAEGTENPFDRRRLRLLMRLALVTGMRLSEIAGSRYGLLYAKPLRDGGGTRWMLRVHGKGDKWRALPLTADLLQLMRADLRARALPDDPRAVPEGEALIVRADGAALSASGISKLVKKAFGETAARLRAAGEIERARVFDRASTHWIRHTTGSFLGDGHAPPSQIQQLLGHASIATTSIYTNTGDDEVYRTVAKVLGEPSGEA